MSVQPGPTFKRYAANGIAPTYTITFLLLDAADLQITLDGALITSGFTLTGIGNPTSSCTFTVPPLGDLLFQQVMPFQRLTDYQINGDFLAQTVNPDFDRLWLAVKQLYRDNGRALTVSLLEPEGIPPLPVIANRALRMLAFDALGQPTPSNLTLEQIEQQPAQALAAAAAAAASANAAHLSEIAAAASASAAAASAAFAGDPWNFQPIGVPIPVFTNLTGVTEPPTNQPYRYIKLTAADAYNTGVLSSESVTGTSPLVQATAVVSLASSPLNGQTVRLMNTERRFLRAGSSGTVEGDQFQGFQVGAVEAGGTRYGDMTANGASGSVATNAGSGFSIERWLASNGAGLSTRLQPVGDGTNGAVRSGTETRGKNIGVTYYMRIK
ncbi:hypothetical protein FBY04_1203 [Pseudomonas sp. SJZ080]|uniref:hypothetical protein n=1 Tax=Pseudomonas sp. SJZ080 TaxID=2572888 RepID=UPI00119A73BA|nr:hypothetical protein [Pseudomonas sp. SJZ080]TWC50110.1 hypothetical protein FBY04_1203 [Pseudomonas sp. SJZ080]